MNKNLFIFKFETNPRIITHGGSALWYLHRTFCKWCVCVYILCRAAINHNLHIWRPMFFQFFEPSPISPSSYRSPFFYIFNMACHTYTRLTPSTTPFKWDVIYGWSHMHICVFGWSNINLHKYLSLFSIWVQQYTHY